MPTDSYLNALASLSEEQFGSEKLAFFGSKSSPKPKKLLGHFHLPVFEGTNFDKPVDVHKHPHYEGDPMPLFGMPVEFHPA
jgi:hypothetical protein